MIQVNGLSKSYGSQILFEEVCFSLNPREKAGLIGRNGHGKSTLLKMILGQEGYDQGEILIPKNYKLGQLQQHISFTKDTVLEEASLGLPDLEKEETYRVKKVLMGLGFKEKDFHRSPSEFSGGFQIRINLCKVLVSKKNLLLLDEPTNYLDIISLRWLARFLKSFNGEVLLITHDQDFMDSIVDSVVGIHRKRVRKIVGLTSNYYNLLVQEEEIYEKTRQNEEKKRKQIEKFITKFRAKARQGSLVQSRIKTLAKTEVKEKLNSMEELEFEFTYQPINGKWPMIVKDLSFSFDEENYLFENLSFSLSIGEKMAIIGQNGLGKSTLLNVLAQKLSSIKGEITTHPQTIVSYFEQTNKMYLNPQLTVEEELKSSNPLMSYTKIRKICAAMMFEGDKALKKIAILSGGERSRVILGKIMCTPCNLLLLDEPTNHLDIESCRSLLKSLRNFKGSVLIVTHNQMILRNLSQKFIVFQKSGPQIFLGSYDEFLAKKGLEGEEVLIKKKSEKKKTSHRSSKKIDNKKKDIQKLEDSILNLEDKKEEINQQLVSACELGLEKDISSLSRDFKNIEERLKQLYEKLSGI